MNDPFPIKVAGVQVRPYWIAHLDDGRTVTEEQLNWNDVPFGRITSLQLQLVGGQKVTISKRGDYQFFQFKDVEFGTSGHRYLGMVIGAVINDAGDCFYVYCGANGNLFVDTDNIRSPKKPYFAPIKLNESILR